MPTMKEFTAALATVADNLPAANAIEHGPGHLFATYHGSPWARVDLGQIVLIALDAAERARADQ